MRAYEVVGEWRHKKTGDMHTLRFVALTADDQPPIDTLDTVMDMGGMEYVSGDIKELGTNTIIIVKKDAIKT